MIGIYSAVANANHMPAWGAAESLLSTNPIAIAVPAGEEPPVVLDIATTVVSYGTVKATKLQGKPMPEGWMVSAKDGKPITDSGEERRRSADADRRPQGLGPCAGAGPARRRAERRGVRPRGGRLQRRRRKRLQHRTFHHCAGCVALHADRGIQIGDRPPAARSEIFAGAAGLRLRSACPASSARRAAPIAPRMACRCSPRWSSSSTSSRPS